MVREGGLERYLDGTGTVLDDVEAKPCWSCNILHTKDRRTQKQRQCYNLEHQRREVMSDDYAFANR